MPVSFDGGDKENVVPSHHPYLLPSHILRKPTSPSLQPLKPLPPSIKPSPLSSRVLRPALQRFGTNRLAGAQRVTAVEVREDSDEEDDVPKKGGQRSAAIAPAPSPPPRSPAPRSPRPPSSVVRSILSPRPLTFSPAMAPSRPSSPAPSPAPLLTPSASLVPPPAAAAPLPLRPSSSNSPSLAPSPAPSLSLAPAAPVPSRSSLSVPSAVPSPASALRPVPSPSPSPIPAPSPAPSPSPIPSPSPSLPPPLTSTSSSSSSTAASVPSTPFLLNKVNYFPISCIGRGGTSIVYRVLSSPTRELFALKVISLTASPSALLSLHTEVDCMRRLQGSPHAIQLYHSEQKADAFYLLLQLGSTDLAHFLHHSPPHPLHVPYLWLSMLQAVDACHRVDILHRDLKPANFVFVDGALRIIDFGIARVMGGEAGDPTSVVSSHLTGTINYMSPESLVGAGEGAEEYRQNRKADVWSLGCILYQMYYGKCPFADVQGLIPKMRAIGDDRHAIPYPETGVAGKVSGTAREVMQRCLERDVGKRASIAELLQHRYVNPD